MWDTLINSECDLVGWVQQFTQNHIHYPVAWWLHAVTGLQRLMVYDEAGQARLFTHPSSLPMATTFPSGFQLRSVCGDSLCCWEAERTFMTYSNHPHLHSAANMEQTVTAGSAGRYICSVTSSLHTWICCPTRGVRSGFTVTGRWSR